MPIGTGASTTDEPNEECLTCPDRKRASVVTASDDGSAIVSLDTQRRCNYNEATFSPSARYYARKCMGPDVPFMEVRDARTNALLVVLNTNEQLPEKLKKRAMPTKMFLTVPLRNTSGYEWGA